VIQVAVELVETVHRRQILVAIAKVIFPKLAGRVAEWLEQLRYRCIARLQAHRGSRETHFRQAGTQRRLAGDE
jgi:hypothetical protein